MDRRKIILNAAARVYAQHGFRGSTTRLIAQEAGVNEVTIFRYFGAKDLLINEAISTFGGVPRLVDLPEHPTNPEHELTAWSASSLANLRVMRSMIRKCMGELEERPEVTACASAAPTTAFRALHAYLERLRALGLARADVDTTAAAAMLMGALFSDAMGRDMMPEAFPAMDAAPRAYAKLLLDAIGYAVASSSKPSRAASR